MRKRFAAFAGTVRRFVRLIPFWWCKRRHTSHHKDYYSDYGKVYFRCDLCGRGHSRQHPRLQPNASGQPRLASTTKENDHV